MSSNEPLSLRKSPKHSSSSVLESTRLSFQHDTKSIDDFDGGKSISSSSPSSKSAIKIFNTWRAACGKTKDKTKDLIRKLKSDDKGVDCSSNEINYDEVVGVTSKKSVEIPTSSPLSGKRVPCLIKQDENNKVILPRDDLGKRKVSGELQRKWTVHVWATYVLRGSLDEDDIDTKIPPPPRDYLSDFQKIKLSHFFKYVLDMNRDDVISAHDFTALNQRIRHYIEWSPECIEYHILKEIHSGFLECFLNNGENLSLCISDNQTEYGRDHVNLEEWLDVWGNLLKDKKNIESLPLWLQYFPKMLFQVINRSGSGTISKDELSSFYTMFLGLDFKVVNETIDKIYKAMTDNGKCKIKYSDYNLCFANFLFARQPHGPGQFIFGICSPESLSCFFPIDYSALNSDPKDLVPYNILYDKQKNCNNNRRSVIV